MCLKRFFKTEAGCFVIAFLIAAIGLTSFNSLAKYYFRAEYPMKLTLTEHFTFSAGQAHSFTVPSDGYYAFQLWGGAGGDSANYWNGGHDVYQKGGAGGIVKAIAYFQKDEILTITVGGKGNTNGGGFNGGGNGGANTSPIFNSYYGGGGGGATDVINSLYDRILVAGGGGGGSGGSLNQFGGGYNPAFGGNGGSEATGYLGMDGFGDGYGLGGSLSDIGNGNYSGGGGGGGFYGGGGGYGSGGGGGGGSSYIENTFTTEVPNWLPDRIFYEVDEKDGFAIVSFLGG